MNSLATRAKLLELEAELQRASLAIKLEGFRRETDWVWVFAALKTTAFWLIRPRRKWFGILSVLSGWFFRRRSTHRAFR